MKRSWQIVFSLVFFSVVSWMWIPHLRRSRPTPPLMNSTLKPRIAQPIMLTVPTESKIEPASPSEKAEISKKLEVLTEILQSKNDNDPRLDRDFKQLSSAFKHALEQKYENINAESRNERGTIVFLVGRNLTTPKDFAFLGRVVAETPCLSLSDCTQGVADNNSEDNNGVDVTLEYPQIVALKSLENYLSKNPASPPALDVLREATKSKSPLVSRMAAQLAQRFSHPNS